MSAAVLPPPFRCSSPGCPGSERPMTLHHGICYRCLHHPEPTVGAVTVKDYVVKVWNCCAGYTAIAGKLDDAGRWIGSGYAAAHMDQNRAVGIALHNALLTAKNGHELCPGCTGDLAGLTELICNDCREHVIVALGGKIEVDHG